MYVCISTNNTMANASEHGFLKDKKNREDTTRLNGSVIKQMYIYIYSTDLSTQEAFPLSTG